MWTFFYIVIVLFSCLVNLTLIEYFSVTLCLYFHFCQLTWCPLGHFHPSPPGSDPALDHVFHVVVVSLEFPLIWNSFSTLLCLSLHWHFKIIQLLCFLKIKCTSFWGLCKVFSWLDSGYTSLIRILNSEWYCVLRVSHIWRPPNEHLPFIGESSFDSTVKVVSSFSLGVACVKFLYPVSKNSALVL